MPRIIAPNGKINSVSGGGVINASHVRGSGIYRKAHTYKSPTEAHIPSMTTALLKDTLVLPETKSQGLFYQIHKEVTFCGLPHGADA